MMTLYEYVNYEIARIHRRWGELKHNPNLIYEILEDLTDVLIAVSAIKRSVDQNNLKN